MTAWFAEGLTEPTVTATRHRGGRLYLAGALFTDYARGIVDTVCDPSRRDARDAYLSAVVELGVLPEPTRAQQSGDEPTSALWQAAVERLHDCFDGLDIDPGMYLSRPAVLRLGHALAATAAPEAGR